jgi:hypothetical protein
MPTCTKCLKNEATLRCKMCHRPICKDCAITTSSGMFCSEECAQKMQAHIEKVKEIDKEKPIIKQKRVPTIIKLLIILVILWLIAHLLGVNVIERLKELIASFS